MRLIDRRDFMKAAGLAFAGSLDTEVVRKVIRETTFKNLVYGNGELRFGDDGQADFPVSITMFDAKKKMRVLAPDSK